MSILRKTSFIVFLLSVLIVGFKSHQPAHAAMFTAVQSGDWDDPATWGGSVPTSPGEYLVADITIPAGIEVIIPISLDIAIGASGNTFANNGTLTNNGYFSLGGTLTNNGTVTNNSTFYIFYTFINNTTF